MHGASKASCGIYCLRDLQRRTQPRQPLRGCNAPGNRPTFAGLRPSRVSRVTTHWNLAGGSWRPGLPSAPLPIWRPPPATLGHRHRVSLQWSIHHLTVRRGGCQPACLDVWQKRHARTPILLQSEDCFSGPARVRISRTALYGNPSRFASGLESSAAWLYPRSRSRWRCSGTGTTTSATSALPCPFTSSASRLREPGPQRLKLFVFQQQHRAFLNRNASRPFKGVCLVPASRAERRPPLVPDRFRPGVSPARGRPQTSQAGCGTATNDARQAWRSARGSRSSATRRRCGIPPGTHRRGPPATSSGERPAARPSRNGLASATQAEI